MGRLFSSRGTSYLLFGKYIDNQSTTVMPDFLYDNKLYYNPVEFALDKIGGTWKMPILWRLKGKVRRYGELKKTMPRISDKVLTSQLRELERDGFVHREAYAEIPPKVEYSLTERGKRSIRIIDFMREYGIELMEEFGVNTPDLDRKE